MQGYSEGFAHIYAMRWTYFAREVAPKIRAFYELTHTGRHNKTALDLACGSGDLAAYLLEHGYSVIGLDLSPAMLMHAREKTAAYVKKGRARFIEGDAGNYVLDEQVGLVVSTFDALNHLPDLETLKGCFASTFDTLTNEGWFIFDLNTRLGLNRWGSINIQEDKDLVLITRGVVAHEEGRAYTQISGFLQQDDGLYKRFSEIVYNTIFDLGAVEAALREAGFRHVHFAQADALDEPVNDPELYGRIFVVAQK
jgi:SAM-dependent methyltransferase